MDIIFAAPVIIKIAVSLFIILAVNKFSKNLAVSILSGVVILAIWSGHTLISLLSLSFQKTVQIDSIMLMGIILSVIFLSSQMSKTKIMKELVMSIRSRFSGRISMAILPAVIGLLPMPGGALFSAPLVDDCDDKKTVSPELKTGINYWFRHIWEYWWPLYPGVLLAVDIAEIEISRFILINFPLTLFAAGGGYFFLLRKIKISRKTAVKGHKNFFALIMPIIIAVSVYTIIQIFIPVIADISKYLPMLSGILCSMIFLQLQRPLGLSDWRKIVLSRKGLMLILIVALVQIYGTVLSGEIPGGSTLIVSLKEELSTFGIPLASLIIFLPFICGLTTGITVGFVGTSFPVIIGLLGVNPEYNILLSSVILAYGSGFTGVLLSPVHVCLIVSNEHYNTRLPGTLRKILLPALTVLAGTLISAYTVYLLY